MGTTVTLPQAEKAPLLSLGAKWCLSLSVLALLAAEFIPELPHAILVWASGVRLLVLAMLIVVGRAIYAVFSPSKFTRGVFILGLLSLLVLVPIVIVTRGNKFGFLVTPALVVYGVYLTYKAWNWLSDRKRKAAHEGAAKSPRVVFIRGVTCLMAAVLLVILARGSRIALLIGPALVLFGGYLIYTAWKLQRERRRGAVSAE